MTTGTYTPTRLERWRATVEADLSLTPGSRHLALVISTFADHETARASPGMRKLADTAGMRYGTTVWLVGKLTCAGYLYRVRKAREGAAGIYALTTPGGDE